MTQLKSTQTSTRQLNEKYQQTDFCPLESPSKATFTVCRSQHAPPLQTPADQLNRHHDKNEPFH